MITSALARKNLAAQSGRCPCVACGGSGVASNGANCHPCRGTGSTALAQHSSVTTEHYTPSVIVEAARTMLGEIDMDPASCELAQDMVKATAWYGPGSPLGEDGLAEPWMGRVFLNPPGGRVTEEYQGMGTHSNAALWWARLASSWQKGEVDAAIFIGFTLEILRSAQAMQVPQPLDFPLCVPSSRIAFDTLNRIVEKKKDKKMIRELIDPTEPEGVRVSSDSPTHANVIVYLPPMRVRIAKSIRENLGTYPETYTFVDVFSAIGRCRV